MGTINYHYQRSAAPHAFLIRCWAKPLYFLYPVCQAFVSKLLDGEAGSDYSCGGRNNFGGAVLAEVKTVAFQGIDARPVDVQVQLASGLPAFSVVGLPDKAVSEARERVRAALSAVGLALPPERITVNLSPADLPKEGSHYDLPIALALLVAMGAVPADSVDNAVILGELGLDASIRAVPGVLPAAMTASALDKDLICPAACGSEAAWAGRCRVIAPSTLMVFMNHVTGRQILADPEPAVSEIAGEELDFRDIKGQESAKRAMEIAAAGGHHMLMIGPPGSGKSMLASRMPSILPPLMPSEALEVSMIASIAGELEGGLISKHRPFRSPHHSASQPALIGGGVRARPGEVSLAHSGVLFLDELPEFSRQTLEALRQPMESAKAVIARAQAHVTYPARFQLVAAMNPCRCGYLGDEDLACNRAPRCGVDYQSKISGPLYDRIDLHVDVPEVSAADLTLPPPSEGSAEIRARVVAARDIQAERYRKRGLSIHTNAEADGKLLEEVAALDGPPLALMKQAVERMKLSARGYHRVLKVARTLADLDSSDHIKERHVAEAIGYRRLSLRAGKL